MPPRSRPTAFEVSFGEEGAGSLQASASAPRRPQAQPAPRATVVPPPAPAKPVCYAPHPYEVPEAADAFVFGEDDAPPDTDDKPIRVLNDFVVFDPRHECQLLSLARLEEEEADCAFEGAGLVTPYFEIEEDAGQEDDDMDGYRPVRMRLGAILRFSIDYTKRDDPVFIETSHAWYILGQPSKKYKQLYTLFFNIHKITQHLVFSLTAKPDKAAADFVEDLDTEILPGGYKPQDLQAAIPTIQSAIEHLDNPAHLLSTPLMKEVLKGRDIIPHTLGARLPNPLSSRLPRRDFSGAGNIDLTVLRRENQNPTHVTPLIAKLAGGFFRERLVVVGPRAARRDGDTARLQREADHVLLINCVVAAATKQHIVKMPREWRVRRHPDYMEAVMINGEKYSINDVVILPQGQDGTRGNKAPRKLPMRKEDVPVSATLADYFWFGKITWISSTSKVFHIQWFEHSTRTFLGEVSNPRELFLTTMCDNIPFSLVVAKVKVMEITTDDVPDALEGYFYRFMHHASDASFVDPLVSPPIDSSSNPRDSCPICLIKVQEDTESSGQDIYDGVAFHGYNYHIDDIALIRSDEGRAVFGQVFSVRPPLHGTHDHRVTVTLLGRMSDFEGADIVKDERHLFMTEERKEYPLSSFIRPVHVHHWDTIKGDVAGWRRTSIDHFFVSWIFPSIHTRDWALRKELTATMFFVCPTCFDEHIVELEEAKHFRENVHKPLCMFDIFAGTGAFSFGMEDALGARTTHAAEIAPSTARSLKKYSPETVVYNQCANVLLRYTIKHHNLGNLQPGEVPENVAGTSHLPPPLKPGDIDVIVAGFPCQPHSNLNMYQKANDVKSNLILNLLSWVDFLRPRFCIFENVRGFLHFNLNTMQSNKYRVEGGIHMGGLRFLVHALLSMNYQVRFGLLQAAHYGTPQTRVRFFLLAAKHGSPLPLLPQPTHDYPLADKMEIKFSNGDTARPIHSSKGKALFPHVTIHDAIADLPRFDWRSPRPNFHIAADGRNVPAVICDQSQQFIGPPLPIQYDSNPQTTFQQKCREKAPDNLQHINRPLRVATVERVIMIPLEARSDYRTLPKEHWEWQFSDPSSYVAKGGFRPGLYGRLDKDGVFQTTVTNVEPTAKQSWVLNPYCRRVVTVRELARSQGFPDNYTFYSLDNDVKTMHRQIGNAVPWPVAEAIGREIHKALHKRWREGRSSAIVVD